MLELGTERQTQPVRHQSDFVLAEKTEQLDRALVGIERDGIGVIDFIRRNTVSSAPDDVLAFAQQEMVLQVDVKGIAVFIQHRSIAHRPVVIQLQLQIRPSRKGVGPSPQHIAAIHIEMALVGLRERRIRYG